MESESHDEAQINEGGRLIKELGGRVIVVPYFNDQSSTLIEPTYLLLKKFLIFVELLS
jgi:hypothetical protein